MATTTEILPEIEEEITEFDGKSHYVRIKALMKGGPVVALCGKKYIPTVVGGAVCDLPICSSCQELYDFLGMME